MRAGEAGLPAVDRATLTPVVRRALGSATVDVGSWEMRPLSAGFNEVTGGICRVVATGSDRGRPVRCALVLKACRDPGAAQGDGPRAAHYWKRELLAYASGLLDALPPGVQAPRCFGAEERPDGTAWLWLEDLAEASETSETSEARWSLARYALAARHAGQTNGAYLGGRPLPAVPWLSTGVARAIAERFGRPIERLPELADHPLVRRQWPDPGMAHRIARLWHERERFFAALARLPQTLGHLDLFRLNLFARRTPDGGDETVAVDWAFLGTAAVGEELAPLVCASTAHADADPARVRELGETAFEGYLTGLREGGWDGDARDARLGYTAGVIRYGLVAFGLLAAIEPEVAAQAERVWGPFGGQLDRYAAVHRYTLDLADEARALIAAGA
jgi:hypothetical protein